jgi:uncharacterized protein (TIGR02588 family)
MGHLVMIQATNVGEQTAAAVTVEGELKRNSRVERRTATFEYIPANSVKTGGLYFTSDPRSGALRLRATGYVQP